MIRIVHTRRATDHGFARSVLSVDHSSNNSRRAFTLIELLIVISIIALLLAILVPALASARSSARTVMCSSNLRSLTTAWTLYANDFADRAMPLAYTSSQDVGPFGTARYWWGSHGSSTTPPDFERGFIHPYLDTSLAANSVLECPAQAWGTFLPQGPGARWPTSTYGYNGYYLSPAKTPGWDATIGHRPWRRLADIKSPAQVFVFADTLIRQGQSLKNCALLDPPMLFTGTPTQPQWQLNTSPTTAFRHGPRIQHSNNGAIASAQALQARNIAAVTSRADTSVHAIKSQPQWLSQGLFVGSVMPASLLVDEAALVELDARANAYYVPDALEW